MFVCVLETREPLLLQALSDLCIIFTVEYTLRQHSFLQEHTKPFIYNVEYRLRLTEIFKPI